MVLEEALKVRMSGKLWASSQKFSLHTDRNTHAHTSEHSHRHSQECSFHLHLSYCFTEIQGQGVCSPPGEIQHSVALLLSRPLQTQAHARTHTHLCTHSPAFSSPQKKIEFHSLAEVLIIKAFLHTIRHKAAFGQTSDSRVETKAAVSEPEESYLQETEHKFDAQVNE